MTSMSRELSKAAARLAVDALVLVHEVLEESGISRIELAERMGVTKGRISQILNGDGNLYLATLARILAALGHEVQMETKRSSPQDEIGIGEESSDNSVPTQGFYEWSTQVTAVADDGSGVVNSKVRHVADVHPGNILTAGVYDGIVFSGQSDGHMRSPEVKLVSAHD